MYYLSQNSATVAFCWKRTINGYWNPLDKYGKPLYGHGTLVDMDIIKLAADQDHCIVSSVTFEKKEIWPKVLENQDIIVIYDGPNVKARSVYDKKNCIVREAADFLYNDWKHHADREFEGTIRERWVRFFQ